MPLIDRIDRALNAGVDTDVFERAAVALLRSRYPWLSPVEAGKDIGRDADIYRVIADNPESRGRILATTGDPIANLRSSHRTWKKQAGFRIDKIVIACTRDITGSIRKTMDKYCQEQSLPLPEYYGRDWFVAELVKNAHWREELTGIRGRMDSLIPSETQRLGDRTPFIGRTATLENLAAALARGEDVVLTGVPGVGKSRLLSEVGPGAGLMLVEPAAKDYLADDLLMLGPGCVAIDDAHLNLGVVSELVRLRAQEGLTFAIVVSAWPDYLDDVGDLLPGHRQMDIGVMPRDEIDVLVRATGVTGIHARRLVLDQADGRPGWATLLCEALVDGAGELAASGELLLNQVERYMRVTADSALTLDAISCIAALNGADADDLQRVSQLVGQPLASLVDGLKRMATRGLLEQHSGQWRPLPAFRIPLVTRWFFGPQKTRGWGSITSAFLDRSYELTATLLVAAGRSEDRAVIIAARDWARALGNPVRWEVDTLNLVRFYAMADQEAADFAARSARAILLAERPIKTTPWGSTYDDVGSAARRVLVACVQTWFNEEATHGLMDAGLTDDRPRQQNQDHPLRVLGEMARYLDPDRGSLFEVRRLLLSHATSWLELNAASRWTVFAEIIAYCFSPSVEGTWTDPAAIRSFTFANGTESPDHLRQLLTLWPEVGALANSPVEMELPDSALHQLVELLESWLQLAGGHGEGSAAVTDEQRAVGAEGAWAIMRTLLPFLQARPGFALKVQRALDLAERWDVQQPEDLPALKLDEELVLFVGRRDVWGSADSWLQQRGDEQVILAQRLHGLGPEAGTGRFVQLTNEAAALGNVGEGDMVARKVLRLASDPTVWIEPAVRHHAPALLRNAVWEAQQQTLPLDDGLILGALEDGILRSSVFRAFLGAGDLDPLAERVLAGLEPGDAWLIQNLHGADSASAVFRVLLNHAVVEIRASASLVFRVEVEGGAELPEQWVSEWESAFLDASENTVHGNLQWTLQEILKGLASTNPRLCADWYEHQLLNGGRASHTNTWMRDLQTIPAGLPSVERERLARIASRTGYRSYDLLPHLLGHDADLASRLIEDGTLDGGDTLDVFTGRLDEGVEVLGPVLLAHGVPPARIARRICSDRQWTGKESDVIKADIAWLEALAERLPAMRPVTEVAIADQQRSLERALEEERDEARRGW